MKFWEAMKALEEGKRVRSKKWTLKSYIDKSSAYTIHLPLPKNYEWELYSEPVKTYKLWELIQALKEGKKIERIGWGGGRSPIKIHLSGCIDTTGSKEYMLCIEDLEASDWMVCE